MKGMAVINIFDLGFTSGCDGDLENLEILEILEILENPA